MLFAYSLKDAREKVAIQPLKRIWAIDRMKENGQWGKAFVIAGYEELFFYCKRNMNKVSNSPQFYELIEPDAPCAFHMDIEFARELVDNLDMDSLKDYFEKKLKRMERMENNHFNDNDNLLDQLVTEYYAIATSEITDEEMVIGTQLLLDSILQFLNATLIVLIVQFSIDIKRRR